MSVLILLIVAGGVVSGGFLAAFAWAVCSGQFDDMATPAVRLLFEDAPASVVRSNSEGPAHVHFRP